MTAHRCCGTCKHADLSMVVDTQNIEDDEVLLCEWYTTVPHSWRYVLRERVGVTYHEGTECPC